VIWIGTRALAASCLLVALACVSGQAVVTPEHGVEAVAQRADGFAVTSQRGMGRFQVEAFGPKHVVVHLRYELGRPIPALEGLEVLEAVSNEAVPDDRVSFEGGTLELEMESGEIWRIRFVDFYR
jgi:hypothetical protein